MLKVLGLAMGLALGAFHFGTTLWAQPSQTSSGGTTTTVSPKPAKDKEEKCRISGTVVKLADGAPLKNATVRLENDEDHEHTIATKTTADGRFELRNIPAGRYKVKVSRNGYVEKEYGQVKPSDPGAALTLSPGENKPPMLFKLIPAAVISGRVFDEDGEPVARAVVTASREVYKEGKRTRSMAGWAETDDLGQFRLFGLAPGKYYISATERGWGQVNGDREFMASGQQQERGYTKTYYPGTTEFAKASVISVKEGEEVLGTDIPLKQVAVYRIRGRVLNQVTHKGGNDAFLGLMARTKRLEWDFAGEQEVKKSDGSFEFPNVVPGSYLLMAYWSDLDNKTYSTQQRIEVGESDIEGVSLIIGTGATIPGHVRWEGRRSLERDELTIGAQPADMPFGWSAPTRVEANDQFTLKEVGDGDYKISVNGVTKDCYVKDVVYGDTHAADDTISVSKGGGAHLEVTISSRGARVQGAVTDKDGLPAAGVWVVAVPDEARRGISGLFKSQTTDQYGKFDLHGLSPGTYKMFSWTGIENGEWEDTDFLKPFEDKGERVELQDDDAKSVSLKLTEKKGERAE